MRGYPVYRVPTVAPGPNSGEAANPQVGPTYLFSAFLKFHLDNYLSRSLAAQGPEKNFCGKNIMLIEWTLGRRCQNLGTTTT
jgi:hypothetical protein